MSVAILGWGSLLWEGGIEFDRWHTKWRSGGPSLRLEFSRISASRLGALTLVIDQEHGTPTAVWWCLSRRTTLDDAICDLRSREGTTSGNIARLLVAQHPVKHAEREPDDPMSAWAHKRKLDAVIWTDLKSNFTEKTKKPFSVESAVAYLQSLSPEAKVKSAEYVWRAPDFVKTPVRSILQSQPWFSEARDARSL